ncbi:hypothetical protein SLEP1_g22414 [Rubroshorea leprosula]|uniref:Integrase catalytic domain-containing protein n=1 Tax=Rubroshorea leprosula TaxID=152421 RepID=A0AAV5JHY2_9ROSI|nr:hypothetical protein SLEP1_g22414 [Rubroshorea leprosula]
MASSFNIVIGRPTLTEIRAVVSQSHLCMKFPTLMGIATLRGNQEVARHCYITSVTQPMKDKAQTPEAIPKQISDNQQVMGVEIIDNRPEDETRAAPVEDVEEVLVDDRDPRRKTQIGTRLNPKERAELIAFLRANNDVFAWTSADMPGIPTSVYQHKLSTNPLKKPVAQKRRLFGGERLQAVKEEVEKLLQAGFVRKVDYCEWVANPVLVKKANGKWRMCIDYTNLNNACPKDYYPMPSIDKLVEAASGNERLSLLDAYSGYHQVPMAPEDEEKTAFYAGDEIYCYVMMPFGLKNAGATYQKMVTIVFHAQIGKNLEVYVDDIVVKSLKAEDHLADLGETFNNLRKNRMRLNPAKCIFGVESGKFLEVLDEPSFTKPRVMEISTNPNAPSWTDSIVSFLRDGIVPEDRQEAMKLRKKASRYTLVNGVLYKRSFSLPLLRCLSPYEAEYALREVHEGVCGSHVGARTLAHKKCPKCQFFAHLAHQPAEELTTLVAPRPFAQWGLDLLGPFVKGVGGVTHLVVGVDYFTKWVEARPLSSLTSKKVEDFVFSSIICRYGIPNQIVADNGT